MNKPNLAFTTQPIEYTDEKLEIEGQLPVWLSGTLIRNGPGQFEIGGKPIKHWFDGLAMLHRFQISGGSVTYTNKMLQSDCYLEAKQHQRFNHDMFAEKPNYPWWQRLYRQCVPKFTDNTNVNIGLVDGQTIALTETPRYIAFDSDTLETQGQFAFQDAVSGQVTTAHPLYDLKQKMIYNVHIQYGPTSHYIIHRMPINSCTREVVAKIPTKQASYMHAFSMTNNYVILFELPLRFSLTALFFSGKTFLDCFHSQEKLGSQIIVVDKRNGELVCRTEVSPFFVFHPMTAYEDKNKLLIDLPIVEEPDFLKQLYLDRLRKEAVPLGTVTRFELDLKTKDCRSYFWTSHALEFPRTNTRVSDPRWCYAVGQSEEQRMNQLLKLDRRTGEAAIWQGDDLSVGEPVFVASPDAKEEDHGVICSVVLEHQQSRSFLLILDATSFSEIARANLPCHIPLGFHGAFLAAN
ncbi:MAG: 15,15' beta carotene dioxygenase [marine bacterium B5-7]|nr:MAG: 15,15' beta carotene dioxygenase [marine bacterium B5-7]